MREICLCIRSFKLTVLTITIIAISIIVAGRVVNAAELYEMSDDYELQSIDEDFEEIHIIEPSPEIMAHDVDFDICQATNDYPDRWSYDTETKTFTVVKEGAQCPDSLRNEIEHVIVNKGIQRIEINAFRGCINLKSVEFLSDSDLWEIGYYSFAGCSSLETIELPKSLTNLVEGAFYESGLEKIVLPDSLANYGGIVFAKCAKLKEAYFPDNDKLTSLKFGTFSQCTSLKKVYVPDSIQIIEGRAFSECKLLEDFDMPENLKKIDGNAFLSCEKLESIEIPDGVTVISESAFEGCKGLKSIKLPDNKAFVTISPRLFYNCSSLGQTKEDLNIPDTVTTISDYAFYGCSSLGKKIVSENEDDEKVETWEVIIPDSVSVIGQGAFSNCGDLESIILPKNPSFTTLHSNTFSYCTSLKSIKIPDSINLNGERVFFECHSLESIQLPKNKDYTSIDKNLFENCKALKNIDIPENIDTIGYATFKGCLTLEKITIPDSVTRVDLTAFTGCSNLKRIDNTSKCSLSIPSTNHKWYNINDTAKTTPITSIKNGTAIRDDYSRNNTSDNTVISGNFDYYSNYIMNDSISSSDDKNYSRSYSFKFDEKWFANDNSEQNYNHELTKMSLALALAALDFPDGATADFMLNGSNVRKGHHIKNVFDQLKLEKYSINYPRPEFASSSIGSAIGHKKLKSGENLVIIAVRGGGYEREWGENFDVLPQKDGLHHNGFCSAAESVIKRLDKYLAENKLTNTNNKYWIVGYSRGAATANLVSAKIVDRGNNGKVFGYCFECPQNTEDPNASAQKYKDCITSIVNPMDIVPRVAMNNGKEWRFTRYGKTYATPSASNTNADDFDSLYQSANTFAQNQLKIGKDIKKGTKVGEMEENNVLNILAAISKETYQKHQNSVGEFIVNLLGGASPELSLLQFADIFSPFDNHLVSKITGMVKGSASDNIFGYHYYDLCLAWVNTLTAANITSVKYTREGIINTHYSSSLVNDGMLESTYGQINLTVYDSKNRIVGQIENGNRTNITGENCAWIDETGQLVFIMPGDEDYRIDISSANDCKISYSLLEKVSGDNITNKIVLYDNVNINAGETISSLIGKVDQTGNAIYKLTKENGSEIPASLIQSGDDIKYYSVKAEIKGNGMVTGEGTYTYGQHARLTAIPDDGYKFKEWQKNGQTFSTSYSCDICVDSDVAVTAIFEDNKFPFKDVKSDKWFYEAVKYVHYNNIMNGTSNSTFEPSKNCTREMMVQILYSAEGRKDVDVTNPFTDNIEGKWYYKSILWGVKNGITSGTSAATFGTGKNVTRQEMAGFLYNYAKYKGFSLSDTKDLSEYVDAGQISGWALEKMKWANANGIINGKSGNKLDPKGTATRAEVAQMIMNFQKKFGN